MAKKQNKVSVNKIDKIIDFNYIDPKPIDIKVDDEIITIEVLPYLTLKERGQFVVDVADSVFIDGTYAPYMLNFAYNFFLLQHCTNMTMPKDAEKVNRLIQTTTIADQVEEIVGDKYLYSDCLDMIEYRKNAYLKNNKTDEFIGSLTSLVDNLNKIAESDEFKSQNLNDILGAVKQFAGKDDKSLVNNILDYREAKKCSKI